MFELLSEVLELFSKSLIKKGTKFAGYGRLKSLILALQKENKQEIIQELIRKRLISPLDIRKYLSQSGAYKKLAKGQLRDTKQDKKKFRDDITNIFAKKNATTLNEDIKSFNEDNKDSPVNVIISLKSSWVRAGKWLPSYTSASGTVQGVMSIWTKTGSKEYIFPNISSTNWNEITQEWTTPYGHGAGSFLWDRNLLKASGANISKRFKLAEKRFKSAFNKTDQEILNKKTLQERNPYIKVPKLLNQAQKNILRKEQAGKWRVLNTSYRAQKQVNKYIIKNNRSK